MKKIFLYISALLAGAACSAQETLLSPDGRLRLEFSLADAPPIRSITRSAP